MSTKSIEALRLAVQDPGAVARFWSKVEKGEGCWEWTAKIDHKGYGSFRPLQNSNVRAASVLAHRLSWSLAFGVAPDGLCVCHRCDNRICVRPDHLFLGTVADNNRDMVSKGRARVGVKGCGGGPGRRNAKLTEDQVREIRVLLAQPNASKEAIARRFGVLYMAIWLIHAGKTWRDVV